MTNGSVLRAAPAILRLHADAQKYASAVNGSIAAAHGGVSPHPLSGGSLYALTADLFGMHRAILSLCEDGWAFAAVALLRSMMDLLLSAAVITEREPEAEYRGFKYTYFFLKARLKDATLSPGACTTLRPRIEKGIKLLAPEHQQRARDFMFKERLWGYWYCPEYKRPTDVLDRLSSAEVRALYDTYSGGSHGGYMGLRILKDEPNQVHPNQRPDPRSQNLALLVSTRLLSDTMSIRDRFENGDAHDVTYRALLDRLVSLRPTAPDAGR